MTDQQKAELTINETSAFTPIINGENGKYVAGAIAFILGVCVVSLTGANLYAISKGYDSTLSLFPMKLTLSHAS